MLVETIDEIRLDKNIQTLHFFTLGTFQDTSRGIFYMPSIVDSENSSNNSEVSSVRSIAIGSVNSQVVPSNPCNVSTEGEYTSASSSTINSED